MDDPVIGNCGHSFNRKEIFLYIMKYKMNSECPICRAPIKEEDLKNNIVLK